MASKGRGYFSQFRTQQPCWEKSGFLLCTRYYNLLNKIFLLYLFPRLFHDFVGEKKVMYCRKSWPQRILFLEKMVQIVKREISAGITFAALLNHITFHLGPSKIYSSFIGKNCAVAGVSCRKGAVKYVYAHFYPSDYVFC